jgi:hypothetical protein
MLMVTVSLAQAAEKPAQARSAATAMNFAGRVRIVLFIIPFRAQPDAGFQQG